MTDTDLQSKLAECEHVIGLLTAKLQETVDENDRLRAVVVKLTEGTDDAHSTLRRLYLDEAQNPNTRVRAAQAALNVEKPSLKPTEAPLELVKEPDYLPLAEVIRLQRARIDRMELEPPFSDLPKVFPLRSDANGNGNGQDD